MKKVDGSIIFNFPESFWITFKKLVCDFEDVYSDFLRKQ